MNCVIGRGYFKEVGRFSSHVYKNTELSQVLRENNPSSLKSAIGFMSVPSLSYTSYLTHIIVISIDVMRVSEPPRASWTPPDPRARLMHKIKGFPRSTSHSISLYLSLSGCQGLNRLIAGNVWAKPCNSSIAWRISMSQKV